MVKRLLDWERDAIVAGIVAGEKEDALAAEFGVSENYPHILGRRRGIPAKPTGRPRKRVQCDKSGLSTSTHIPSGALMVPAK